MFDRNWTPPPPHWGTALQGGLANIGAVLTDNDREQKRRKRESLLDTRDQERWETGLLLTPGVRRPGEGVDVPAPTRPGVAPGGGGGPMAVSDDPGTPQLPGLSGALGGGSSRTMLPGGFEYNPNHQQEQEAADRARVREAVLPALRATYGDDAEAMADLIANGRSPGDVAYQPLSRDQQLADTREVTQIGEESSIRVGQAPRWTPPPAPATPQLMTTIGPDGSPQFESVTPGQIPTGRPAVGGGRDPFARELPGFDEVFKQVSDDERYAELPFEQRMDIARRAIAGAPLPEPSNPVPADERGESEGPGLLRRIGGAVHRSLNPVTGMAPRSQSGAAEIPPPPRRTPSVGAGPDTAAAPAPTPPAPAGTRPREVLDAAVQFYAPLPAEQREAAMREDGATGPEIQYMMSKIGR